MNTFANALFNLRQMDELAAKSSLVHRLHPLSKILMTMVFLVIVVSFDKYEISGLLGLFLYPVAVISMAGLPWGIMVKRLLVMEPVVIGIGILNPIFDHQLYQIGNLSISAGWIVFLSILLKGTLTLSAGLVLVATTGVDRIAAGLRMIHIPKILVLQFLLTYRYLLVLIEEVGRMSRAYFLRAPDDKGIRFSAWGSFAGQLLLRTFDRAQRIYISMMLRGFEGEYHFGAVSPMGKRDIIYILICSAMFFLGRLVSLTDLITYFMKGAFSI